MSRLIPRLHSIWRRRFLLPFLRRVAPEQNVSVNGFALRVNLRDEIIGTFLWRDAAYEAEVLSVIEGLNLDGKVCVDVGANIGLHTLAMSGRAAQVVSFEPESYNFQLLQHNISINNLQNVTAFQCALSDAAGDLHLAVNSHNYGDHRISANGISVPSNTGDHFLKHTAENSIALIKIDVQGFECRVLSGLTETLQRNPDVVLILEIFPEGLRQAGASPTQLVDTLKREGFEGREIHAHRVIPFLDASAYESFSDGADVNVVLSRSAICLPPSNSSHCTEP